MDDAMVRRGHLGPKKEGSRMGIFILAFLAFLCSLFSVGCAEAAGFEKSVEWRALVVSEGPRSGLGIAPIVRRLSREGYEVDVRTAAGAQRQGHRADLMRWGKRVYGKVALLAPTASNLPEGSSVHSLRRFFDAGGDLLLALTPDSPEHTRDLASSMGADPFPPGSLYGNGSAKGMSQHLDWASELLAGRPGLIGESVDVTDALPLATSPESSTASPVLPADDHVCPLGACGRASTPMVAVEGRNGARAIVVGHPSLLSPRLPLAERAIAWAFHEANSFRLKSFLHWHAGSGGGAFLNPPNYKVQDSVEVEAEVEAWNQGHRAWLPAEPEGLQIEWVMLDPHVRKTMRGEEGKMRTALKAPDRSGVFKWRLALRSPGKSKIVVEKPCPIRPLRHNEFARFLSAAYPYYAACLACLVSFLAVCAITLGHASA